MVLCENNGPQNTRTSSPSKTKFPIQILLQDDDYGGSLLEIPVTRAVREPSLPQRIEELEDNVL